MKIKNGQTVNLHYVGTLNDGTEFDNSRSRGTPLKFEFGSGQILPAFEKAVSSMVIGESKKFSLTPDEAYGQVRPDAVQSLPRTQFGAVDDLSVGAKVSGQNTAGQPIQATIKSVNDDMVTLDFNHPLAGKDITFDIELLSVD